MRLLDSTFPKGKKSLQSWLRATWMFWLRKTGSGVPKVPQMDIMSTLSFLVPPPCCVPPITYLLFLKLKQYFLRLSLQVVQKFMVVLLFHSKCWDYRTELRPLPLFAILNQIIQTSYHLQNRSELVSWRCLCYELVDKEAQCQDSVKKRTQKGRTEGFLP